MGDGEYNYGRTMPGYLCVWDYRVRPGLQAAFRRIYGPDGDWARLFRRAPGFVRTELCHDSAHPDHFLAIDYWESQAAWQAFHSRYAADYDALDERCATHAQGLR